MPGICWGGRAEPPGRWGPALKSTASAERRRIVTRHQHQGLAECLGDDGAVSGLPGALSLPTVPWRRAVGQASRHPPSSGILAPPLAPARSRTATVSGRCETWPIQGQAFHGVPQLPPISGQILLGPAFAEPMRVVTVRQKGAGRDPSAMGSGKSSFPSTTPRVSQATPQRRSSSSTVLFTRAERGSALTTSAWEAEATTPPVAPVSTSTVAMRKRAGSSWAMSGATSTC